MTRRVEPCPCTDGGWGLVVECRGRCCDLESETRWEMMINHQKKRIISIRVIARRYPLSLFDGVSLTYALLSTAIVHCVDCSFFTPLVTFFLLLSIIPCNDVFGSLSGCLLDYPLKRYLFLLTLLYAVLFSFGCFLRLCQSFSSPLGAIERAVC